MGILHVCVHVKWCLGGEERWSGGGLFVVLHDSSVFPPIEPPRGGGEVGVGVWRWRVRGGHGECWMDILIPFRQCTKMENACGGYVNMLSSDSSTGKEVFSLDRGLGTPFPLSHVPWVGQVYKQNTVPNPSSEGAETHELDQTPPPWRLDDDVTKRQKVYLGGSAEWEHDFAFAGCFLHRAGLSRSGEGERWGAGPGWD